MYMLQDGDVVEMDCSSALSTVFQELDSVYGVHWSIRDFRED